MKFIHTADWHLGRTLYGRSRHAEHRRFLRWLSNTVASEQVDALVIAGDVFDSASPSVESQDLYFSFLARVAESACRLVVVTSGECDSGPLLEAPRELLKSSKVQVTGTHASSVSGGVLVLVDATAQPQAIVCAVPALPEHLMRPAQVWMSSLERAKALVGGIRDHYAKVFEAAERERARIGQQVPVIATGHLALAGAHVTPGEGLRPLYAGLPVAPAIDMFPETIDYVALGHCHQPQSLAGIDTRAYCGSPIAHSFSELTRAKVVMRVEVGGEHAVVRPIEAPVSQELVQVRGDCAKIADGLSKLAGAGSTAWVEVVHEGPEGPDELQSNIERALAGSEVDVLAVRDVRFESGTSPGNVGQTPLEPRAMFDKRLELLQVPEAERAQLRASHEELLQELGQLPQSSAQEGPVA